MNIKHILIFALLPLSLTVNAYNAVVPSLLHYIDNEMTSSGTILVPELSESGQYTVNWSLALSQEYYVLEERELYSNTSQWQTVYQGQNNQFSANKSLNSQFEYRVKTCNSNYCSNTILSNAITVDIPLTSPINLQASTTDNTHTVSWDAVAQANSYKIEFNFNNAGWQSLATTSETNYSHYIANTGSVIYRVKACETGETDCSSWSASTHALISEFNFQPVSSVNASISSGRHYINWSTVENANRYYIWLSVNGNGWDRVIYTSNTSFDHSPYISGAYTYRIQACARISTLEECAVWSDASNTIVNGTDQSVPQNVVASKSGHQHNINWNQVGDPLLHTVDYNLEISFNNSNFVYATKTPSTNFSHTPILAGEYKYRVQACYHYEGDELCDSWSAPSNTIESTVQTGTPQNLKASIEQNKHTLSWQLVGDPLYQTVEYKVEYSYNYGDFAYLANVLTNSFEHVPQVMGRYRYRVQACFIYNGSESCSTWSNISNGVGELLAPEPPQNLIASVRSDGANVIIWDKVADANHYRMELNLNGTGWQPMQYTNGTQFDHEPPAGRYQYRVNACSGSPQDEACSDWSAVSNTIGELAAPEPPQNLVASIRSSDKYHIITWEEVADANHYRFELNVNGTGWQPMQYNTLNSFSHKPPAGRYQYRVNACSGSPQDEACSDWSAVSNTIGELAAPEPPQNLIASIRSSDKYHIITWDEVADANHYRFELNVNGTGWQPMQYNTLNSFSHKPPAGRYQYRVNACSGSPQDEACSEWSAVSNAIGDVANKIQAIQIQLLGKPVKGAQ